MKFLMVIFCLNILFFLDRFRDSSGPDSGCCERRRNNTCMYGWKYKGVLRTSHFYSGSKPRIENMFCKMGWSWVSHIIGCIAGGVDRRIWGCCCCWVILSSRVFASSVRMHDCLFCSAMHRCAFLSVMVSASRLHKHQCTVQCTITMTVCVVIRGVTGPTDACTAVTHSQPPQHHTSSNVTSSYIVT